MKKQKETKKAPAAKPKEEEKTSTEHAQHTPKQKKVPFWKKPRKKPKKQEEKIPSFRAQMRAQAAARKAKNKRKRLTTQERKRNLDTYLSKAGFFDVNTERLKQRVFRLAIHLIATIWVIPVFMAIINQRELLVLIPYTLGIWIFGLLGVWLLLWGIIYFYLEMRIYHRTKELEDVLPDFLQLTSSNISAGMPIDRALWLAIRPNFGVLAKEIEDVAKATLSGEDLSDSLKKFVGRYESKTLKRSISILLEGLESGGELADLLNKISLNIQELKIMKKEMAANVTTYAIFISFASVGIAPVLFALATQLVAIILSITGGLDLSAAGSSIAITTTVNPEILGNFRTYSYAMLAVTAGMSAAIISVIQRGNVRDGIRNIPVFIAVSLAIYFIASYLFGGLFSGFF